MDIPSMDNNRMHVPILLPTGQDAHLACKLLTEESIFCVECSSFDEMLDHIRTGCSFAVIGDEAIGKRELNRLLAALDQQPDWSDMPVIILTGQRFNFSGKKQLAPRRNLHVLQRPVRKSIFLNLITAVTEIRQRQFEVKGLLDHLAETNVQLRLHTSKLQKLALELTHAENRERRRIADILHDDLQQMLAYAKLESDVLAHSLTDQKMAQKAKQINTILFQAMKTSRSLSHELNPAMIYGNSLSASLQKLGYKMGGQYGFQVKMIIENEPDGIEDEIKPFVYKCVQELLFNCAKHASADKVDIRLNTRGNFLKIHVMDNGVGFDVDQWQDEGGESGGLGLFSIQERALALGGSLRIASKTPPETGTCFVLTVPLFLHDASVSTEGTRIPETENEKIQTIRVLLADDHSVMRHGLASLLKNQPGFEVVGEAADGIHVMALAKEARPHVILMDVSMPGQDGIVTTQKIKQALPDIAVVGLTMHTDPHIERKMLDAGADAYLLKDTPAKELLDTLRMFEDRT